MLENQQLVYTLGAAMVISDSRGFFEVPRANWSPAPSSGTQNDFAQAVRTLLAGSTALTACLNEE